MRRMIWLVPLLVFAAIVGSACATKKFVRTEVGAVNAKVDALGGTVEQMQGRISNDEARLGQVDLKAEAAGRSAQQAQDAADAAAQSARQVGTHVDQVAADLTANIASGRKLLYEVTLNEEQGNFTFGKADLPEVAKTRIDQVVGQLKGQVGKDIYIEVEGYTDNIGTDAWNYQLGLDRAEAVQRYLYMQHQIPLHKVGVFSYGEEKPVAPNTTREGRAQNRRVILRILS